MSLKEPSLFSGHYWSAMVYFLPCWVMVLGLTVFHSSNKYLSLTSFWCIQIPALFLIVYGINCVQVLGSNHFQCLYNSPAMGKRKKMYSVLRKAHLLSVLALFYHLAIFLIYIIDWNYVPEEDAWVQNEFYGDIYVPKCGVDLSSTQVQSLTFSCLKAANFRTILKI
jgi:hypothetical protein